MQGQWILPLLFFIASVHCQEAHEAIPSHAHPAENAAHNHTGEKQAHTQTVQGDHAAQAHPLPAEFLMENAATSKETRSAPNAPEAEASKAETVTPEGATGHDWVFNGTSAKRSAAGLESKVKMFSTERACGFAIETERGTMYPWMVTIIGSRVQCTGTLVSNSLVVTSASCILACGTDTVRVILGDPRLQGCGAKGIETIAVTAVVHPKYTASKSPEFDTGLIQIQTPVDFNRNPFVYPVCLVGVETDDPNIECDSVMGGVQSGIQSSPVNCFQPGNQLCSSNGLTGGTGCIRLQKCFPISSQPSVPVLCRRRGTARYYLWGVTTSSHDPTSCTSLVARTSDSFSFIAQGLGF